MKHMSETEKAVVLIALLMTIVASWSVMLVQSNAIKEAKSMAIKAECASYNNKTGDFEWIIK